MTLAVVRSPWLNEVAALMSTVPDSAVRLPSIANWVALSVMPSKALTSALMSMVSPVKVSVPPATPIGASTTISPVAGVLVPPRSTSPWLTARFTVPDRARGSRNSTRSVPSRTMVPVVIV